MMPYTGSVTWDIVTVASGESASKAFFTSSNTAMPGSRMNWSPRRSRSRARGLKPTLVSLSLAFGALIYAIIRLDCPRGWCQTSRHPIFGWVLPVGGSFGTTCSHVLTTEEARLIDSARNLMHRAILMTLYSTGGRLLPPLRTRSVRRASGLLETPCLIYGSGRFVADSYKGPGCAALVPTDIR